MNRISILAWCSGWLFAAAGDPGGAKAQTLPSIPDYSVQLDVIQSGFDKETCWVHPRAGVIPGASPVAVLTMQKLWLKGSDICYALHEIRLRQPGLCGQVALGSLNGSRRHTAPSASGAPGTTIS